MRIYELVFIVSPEVEGDSLDSVVGDVLRYVERTGGTVLRTNPWGLRRLAYPIRDFWEGHYFLMYLEFDPESVAEFERSLLLIEPVMRHLIVLTQDKIQSSVKSEDAPLEVEDDWEDSAAEAAGATEAAVDADGADDESADVASEDDSD